MLYEVGIFEFGERFLMFTPKRWSDWSLTPRTGTGSGREMNSGKAKLNSGEGRGVVLFEPTTPATGLVENGDRDGITRKLLELENEVCVECNSCYLSILLFLLCSVCLFFNFCFVLIINF